MHPGESGRAGGFHVSIAQRWAESYRSPMNGSSKPKELIVERLHGPDICKCELGDLHQTDLKTYIETAGEPFTTYIIGYHSRREEDPKYLDIDTAWFHNSRKIVVSCPEDDSELHNTDGHTVVLPDGLTFLEPVSPKRRKNSKRLPTDEEIVNFTLEQFCDGLGELAWGSFEDGPAACPFCGDIVWDDEPACDHFIATTFDWWPNKVPFDTIPFFSTEIDTAWSRDQLGQAFGDILPLILSAYLGYDCDLPEDISFPVSLTSANDKLLFDALMDFVPGVEVETWRIEATGTSCCRANYYCEDEHFQDKIDKIIERLRLGFEQLENGTERTS